MDIRTDLRTNVLVVEYTIHNVVAEPLYLCNLHQDHYGVLGDPSVDPRGNRRAGVTSSLAFTRFEAPDTAMLFVGTAALPEDHEVFAPRAPLATRLLPGERFTAAIRAPLPLLEWHSYEPPETQPTEPVTVRRVHLRVEYLAASDALYAEEHPVLKGAFSVGDSRSRFFEAETSLDAPCILLRRTDLKMSWE